jgi:hypothetical protein
MDGQMGGRMDRQTERQMDTVQVNSGSNMPRESNSVEPYCKRMWTENEYFQDSDLEIFK